LLAVAGVRASRYEAEFPVRAFAAQIRNALPAGEPVYSLYEDYNNIVAVYLDRPLKPLASVEALDRGRRPGPPLFALLGPDARLDGARPVAEADLDGRQVTLVRLEPVPG